jgi:hypothetical protein
MLVKDIPDCLILIADTSKSGNTGVCYKSAMIGISLDGKTLNACIDHTARRLAILGDAIDKASIVFYVKDKKG